MQWLYNNTEINKDYDFNNHVGFVYSITNILTGRKYIGKKLAITIKKLPPLKGRKNKRHKKVQTNWLDYYGSSDELKHDIDKYGKGVFIREIICFAENKQELNYYELILQVKFDVLDSQFKDGMRKFYNKNISRIFYPTEKYNKTRQYIFRYH